MATPVVPALDQVDSADYLQLVADIGGTNARFALHDAATGRLGEVRTLAATDYPDISTAIEAYLAAVGSPRVAEACFAVACPAKSDLIALTNSAWRFSRGDTARRFKLARLLTINDFEALALGVPRIGPDGLHCLRPGTADDGAPKAVIGPGTGLGVSGLIPVSGAGADVRWFALSGEGGHVGFAPQGELEIDLLRFLTRRHNRASAERVLSGQGLENLYEFLAERAGLSGQRLTPADITTRGLVEGDALARAALDLFLSVLGGMAGDLALTLGARGGVYIGGGIVPRILSILPQSTFIARFQDKGRLSAMLTPIPIFVIRDSSAALLGAATALRGTGERP